MAGAPQDKATALELFEQTLRRALRALPDVDLPDEAEASYRAFVAEARKLSREDRTLLVNYLTNPEMQRLRRLQQEFLYDDDPLHPAPGDDGTFMASEFHALYAADQCGEISRAELRERLSNTAVVIDGHLKRFGDCSAEDCRRLLAAQHRALEWEASL